MQIISYICFQVILCTVEITDNKWRINIKLYKDYIRLTFLH